MVFLEEKKIFLSFDMEEQKYLTVQEFAYKLGVSASAVYKAIKEGKLAFEEVQVGLSSKRRIPKSELDRLKKKG